MPTHSLRIILCVILLCASSCVLAQTNTTGDEMEDLYYNGLSAQYLYPGTLYESAHKIYYTGHKDYSFYIIPVTPGDTLMASAGVMKSTLLLLKSKYDPAESSNLEYAGSQDESIIKLNYSSVSRVIPYDAHYLYVCNTVNNDNVLPTELIIGGHNILEPKTKELSFKLSQRIITSGEDRLSYRAALSPETASKILGEEIDHFDAPIMVVCDNDERTIIIGAETYCKSGVKWMTAISNDGGKSFMPHINYLRDRDGNIKTDKEGEYIVVPITELLYDRIHDRLLSLTASYCYASDDYGETWYQLSYFGNSIKRPAQYNHTMYSPTTGIQLANGVLVAPMRFYYKDEANNRITQAVNYIVYSSDYGKTWKQTITTPADIISDECLVVEYKKNRVMINSRGGTEYWMEKTNHGRRVFVSDVKSRNCRSKWEIKEWKMESESDGTIYDPICNAAIISLPKSIGKGALFTNPNMPGEYWPRKNLTLKYTSNYKQWDNVSLLTPYAKKVRGYTALGASDEDIYFAYADNQGRILFTSILSLLKDL